MLVYQRVSLDLNPPPNFMHPESSVSRNLYYQHIFLTILKSNFKIQKMSLMTSLLAILAQRKKSAAQQNHIQPIVMALQGQVQVVPDDGRGVYVGGLPKHAEWQELKDHMKYLG